jgi:hypothetical protein
MNQIINFTKRFGIQIVSFALPLMAAAQAPAQFTGGTAPPQAKISSLQGVLNDVCTVFGWMFYFLIALAVVFIVIAGYRYLTASGDPEKVKSANRTIIYAAIAVGVALLATAIPLVVASFLGASGGSGIGNCGAGGGGGGFDPTL